jgi:hypothetical protein
VLVGREREQGCCAHLDALPADRGGVLVGGEAGIGTALLLYGWRTRRLAADRWLCSARATPSLNAPLGTGAQNNVSCCATHRSSWGRISSTNEPCRRLTTVPVSTMMATPFLLKRR